MKKVKVIKKILKAPCACTCPDNKKPDKNCKSCNGSGIYRDYHYVLIVGKTAWDMDTLK